MTPEEKQQFFSSKTVFDAKVLAETSDGKEAGTGPNDTNSGTVSGGTNNSSGDVSTDLPSSTVTENNSANNNSASNSNSNINTPPEGSGPDNANEGTVAGSTPAPGNQAPGSDNTNTGTTSAPEQSNNTDQTHPNHDNQDQRLPSSTTETANPQSGSVQGGGGATASPQAASPSSSSPASNNAPGAIEASYIPVKYLCSDQRTEANNGNVKTSTLLTLTVTDTKTKEVLCSVTDEKIKKIILDQKKLYLPPECQPTMPNLRLTITLTEAKAGTLGSSSTHSYKKSKGINFSGQTRNFLYGEIILNNSSLKGISDSQVTGTYLAGSLATVLYVLVDKKTQTKPLSKNNPDVCDKRASPLFVDFSSNESLTLTPPTEGIYFDILGRQSYPEAHTKKQISWLENKNFMFLVNPLKGKIVAGIDQMFGDNTAGPDGSFADNGFEALAKYDQNHDGIINRKDPIFKALRLWSDNNNDGLAEPGELFYLSYMNVKAIDLEYDRHYYERDIYGNEIKYKSIVQMNDDSVKMMFDLWFRYL